MTEQHPSNEAPETQEQEKIDIGRRKFLTKATAIAGGIAIGSVAVPFLSTWQPSARTKSAGLILEVDLANLKSGEMTRGVWRKKPIFIIKRTPTDIKALAQNDPELADPNSKTSEQPPECRNPYRSISPKYAVIIGVCTHLGCAPNYQQSDGQKPGVLFCPCHGSKFDLAGRVYQNMPATRNLVIPPYQFLTETTIEIS